MSIGGIRLQFQSSMHEIQRQILILGLFVMMTGEQKRKAQGKGGIRPARIGTGDSFVLTFPCVKRVLLYTLLARALVYCIIYE